MLTWKGDWKAPCGVLSHKAQATADLVQPPAQQQGLIFRFISVVDVLLGKTTALLSLKRSSAPFLLTCPSPPAYIGHPREHFPHFLQPHLPSLSLGSVWLGESRDLKGDSDTQVRVSAECWPSCAHDKAPSHLKGRDDPEIRHFIASQGQLGLRMGAQPPGGGPFGGLRGLGRP